MKNIILKIISSTSEYSSKRVIALFTSLLLAYVVIRYTTPQNAIQMSWALITFIGTLVGVTVTQDVLKSKLPKDGKEKPRE